MALKDSFLAKLRGIGRDKEDRPEPPQEASAPAQAQPEQKRAELDLPGDHPIHQLRVLYADRAAVPPPAPCLGFEALLSRLPAQGAEPAGHTGEPTLPLTRQEAEQELHKLEEQVTRSAGKRLAAIREAAAASEKAAQAKLPPAADGAPPPRVQVPPPDMDAEIEIFVTARRMTAWLLAYPPSGRGAELNNKLIKQALDASGVSYGLDSGLLGSLSAAPDRYFKLHPIAVGKMPVHGKDGSIIDLFSRQPVQSLKEDDSGRVDFAALELFQNAKKGDMICRIIPPTEPSDGTNVLGQDLPARPGKPASVPKGRNTELAEDGGSLIASCDGHVEFSSRSFQVKPVLEIGSNVDFSTGNINSVGDVHIHGDVRSGFTVRATGSITVDGVIEACTVEAGGDLVVRKGVQGSEQAVLRSHRNVYVKYMESCTVYARENLEADSIINCRVYSDKDVIARSGRGAIIGGEIHASHDVSANIVGTRAELPTSVFLGGAPFEDFEKVNLTQAIEELEHLLEKLDKQPDSPVKLQRMSKTRMQIAANKLKLRQFEKELDLLEGGLDTEPPPSHGRLICGTLNPGVEITIDGVFRRVDNEYQSCMTSISKGEIQFI